METTTPADALGAPAYLYLLTFGGVIKIRAFVRRSREPGQLYRWRRCEAFPSPTSPETGKSGKLRPLAPATVNEAYANRGHFAGNVYQIGEHSHTRGHFSV